MSEDPELKLFPRKIRNYLIMRVTIIYIIVGGVSILMGFAFDDLISTSFDPNIGPLVLTLIIIGFVFGINLSLQAWTQFYPFPKELEDLIKRAGLKVRKKKFYQFGFFRRTRIYPTENTFIKIGLEVKYFPFLELRKGTCKINMITQKLCDASDPICSRIVQDIAEKNLLAWKNPNEIRKARVVNKLGELHFKTSCSPEEAISRLFQMSKAIKEWEAAISKISKLVTSSDII